MKTRLKVKNYSDLKTDTDKMRNKIKELDFEIKRIKEIQEECRKEINRIYSILSA